MYISSIKEQPITTNQIKLYGCNSLFLCTLAVLRNSLHNFQFIFEQAVIRFFYVH